MSIGGEIHAVANVALFAEWEMVLGRPEHRAPQSLTETDIGQALDELAVRIIAAERHFSWRPELLDPNDEMVLEAAINGQASVIVTFEVRTFKAAAKRYGIAVMTPRQVCAKLKL